MVEFGIVVSSLRYKKQEAGSSYVVVVQGLGTCLDKLIMSHLVKHGSLHSYQAGKLKDEVVGLIHLIIS